MLESISMIRIVVVDDQPLVRAGIALLVASEEDITIVAEAADGQDGLTQIRAQRPDVVLMDVRMPGIDGVAATRAVVEEGLTGENGRPVGVIILTNYGIDEAVYDALRAGASGFLLKDAAPTELVAAIRAVASGEAWLDPAVTRLLIDQLTARPEPYKPTPAQMSQMAQLTPRERDVLIMLSKGMSNAHVAKKLFISEATVKTHLAHVMTKLGVREKAQAIIAAYQTGIVPP
jgi:DNA-binding NarL/FixJ family response regulator